MLGHCSLTFYSHAPRLPAYPSIKAVIFILRSPIDLIFIGVYLFFKYQAPEVKAYFFCFYYFKLVGDVTQRKNKWFLLYCLLVLQYYAPTLIYRWVYTVFFQFVKYWPKDTSAVLHGRL